MLASTRVCLGLTAGLPAMVRASAPLDSERRCTLADAQYPFPRVTRADRHAVPSVLKHLQILRYSTPKTVSPLQMNDRRFCDGCS